MPVIFEVRNERHHLSYEITMQAAFSNSAGRNFADSRDSVKIPSCLQSAIAYQTLWVIYSLEGERAPILMRWSAQNISHSFNRRECRCCLSEALKNLAPLSKKLYYLVLVLPSTQLVLALNCPDT